MRLAMLSVARTVVVPMQDVLRLDNSARMNTPGVAAGNWTWRLGPEGCWAQLVRGRVCMLAVSARALTSSLVFPLSLRRPANSGAWLPRTTASPRARPGSSARRHRLVQVTMTLARPPFRCGLHLLRSEIDSTR